MAAALLLGVAYALIVYGALVATFHAWQWLGQPEPTGKVDLGGISKLEEDVT